MNKILLVLFLGVCNMNLMAQKVISPEKVKECFLQTHDTLSFSNCDLILDTPPYVYEYVMQGEQLRTVRNRILPPSVWGWMFGNEETGYVMDGHDHIQQKGEQRILCWMGLRGHPSNMEVNVRKTLKRRYGCIKTRDRQIEGVPAAWVSDTLQVVWNVRPYGGLYLCNCNYYVINKHGAAIEHEIHSREYFGDNAVDDTDYTRNAFHVKLLDLFWNAGHSFDHSGRTIAITNFSEMLLLAYEVNKFCSSSYSGKSHSVEIPIYVYMRKDGHCEMEVLDSAGLQSADQLLVAELKGAFRQIQPFPFGIQYTIDGEIMPGKILQATHEGAWTFREIGKIYPFDLNHHWNPIFEK